MKILRLTHFFVLSTALTLAATARAEEGDAFLVNRTQVFHPEAQSPVEIPEGAMMVILDSRAEFVHVGIDSDIESLPSDLWIRSSEFETAGLEALDQGVDEGAIDLTGRKGGKRKMTYCYRFVKLYLMKKGLVRGYLPGSSAWQAKHYLPGQGFRLTGSGPSGAQINDVCVYTGGNGNNGHIEIRTSSGWYYGYGYKSSPISLSNHRLIGCYRKG